MCWFHWPFKRTRRQLKDQSFSFSSLALVFICCACVNGRFYLTQHFLFVVLVPVLCSLHLRKQGSGGVVTSAFWDCFGNVTAQLYEAKANKKNISVNSVHFCFSSLFFFFFSFFFVVARSKKSDLSKFPEK